MIGDGGVGGLKGFGSEAAGESERREGGGVPSLRLHPVTVNER